MMISQFNVIVRGHIPAGWSILFEGMDVISQPDGNTLITGDLPDQSALFGLLLRLRDMGLTLVSVNSADLPEKENHDKSLEET